MNHISLFSGIGGAEIAAEWAGWRNVLSCDINEFGNKILEYYWPEAYHHKDIHTLNYDTINAELTRRYGNWREEGVIITGGFPCQPYSAAGKRKGTEDARHLWPEMLRIIREVSPDWVVGENVYGLVNWSGGLVFEQVQADLEACGYEVQPVILPACGVNAPHKRDRVWFIAAHASSNAITRQNGQSVKTERKGIATNVKVGGRQFKAVQPKGLHDLSWATSNPASQGREERIESGGRSDSEETGTRLDNRPERPSSIGNVTDPNQLDGDVSGFRAGEVSQQQKAELCGCDVADPMCRRQSCKEHRKTESGWIAKTSIPTDWSDFPTQPPVCGKYDGIPRKLDGITFSKWRNESIKGFGNAWVPEVALQIFNAINEFNKL
jgi:DNA (cytosine-5)-methyltransferase 1